MSAREELRELIPEFEWIQNDDLRNKVLDVWEAALAEGGWVVKDLERMPFTLLLDPCPATMLQHVRGVTKTCGAVEEIFRTTYKHSAELNRDYLIAGALLHDIGKLVEYAESGGNFVKSRSGALLRHPFSGVGLAYKHGIPAEIMHIIAMHSKEGDVGKRTAEGAILHHADFSNFEPFH